jgi:hypothetical protein
MASSSQTNASTHPLTAVNLATLEASPPSADTEKIARLQEAALELGFELSPEWLQRSARELDEWLAAQRRTARDVSEMEKNEASAQQSPRA